MTDPWRRSAVQTPLTTYGLPTPRLPISPSARRRRTSPEKNCPIGKTARRHRTKKGGYRTKKGGYRTIFWDHLEKLSDGHLQRDVIGQCLSDDVLRRMPFGGSLRNWGPPKRSSAGRMLRKTSLFQILDTAISHCQGSLPAEGSRPSSFFIPETGISPNTPFPSSTLRFGVPKPPEAIGRYW